jgi:hypothetical protein
VGSLVHRGWDAYQRTIAADYEREPSRASRAYRLMLLGGQLVRHGRDGTAVLALAAADLEQPFSAAQADWAAESLVEVRNLLVEQALDRGGDPTVVLRAAEASLRRAWDGAAPVAGLWVADANHAVLRARAEIAAGRDPSSSFARCDTSLRRAAEAKAPGSAIDAALATCAYHRAEWLARRRRPVGGEVTAGIAAAERALGTNASDDEAILALAGLRLVAREQDHEAGALADAAIARARQVTPENPRLEEWETRASRATAPARRSD